MNNRHSSRTMIMVYLAVCLTSALLAAIFKGIWYDEFFSQFFARHDLPLAATYRLRWAADVHPIFIYAWSWLWEPVVGDDIGHLRLLNIVPALMSGCALMWIRQRSPVAGSVPIVGFLLFAASPLVFDYFIQDRPYFWIVSSGLVVSTIVVVVERGERISRSLALLLLVATIFFINMQFLCGMFAACGLTAIALLWWLRGRTFWAGTMLFGIALASLLVLVQAYGQWQTLSSTSAHSWIRTSPAAAMMALLSCVGLTVGGGIVATLNARQFSREFVTCMLFVAIVSILAMGGNLFKPIIVRQYLCPIIPFIITAIAAASAERLFSRRAILVAFLSSEALVSISYGVLRSRVKDADRLAAYIGDEVRRCPSTRVVGLPPWYGQQRYLLRVEPAVIENAYNELGNKYGFRLNGAPSARCPVIYWGEHTGAPRAGLLPPGQLTLSETGYALVVPPG